MKDNFGSTWNAIPFSSWFTVALNSKSQNGLCVSLYLEFVGDLFYCGKSNSNFWFATERNVSVTMCAFLNCRMQKAILLCKSPETSAFCNLHLHLAHCYWEYDKCWRPKMVGGLHFPGSYTRYNKIHSSIFKLLILVVILLWKFMVSFRLFRGLAMLSRPCGVLLASCLRIWGWSLSALTASLPLKINGWKTSLLFGMAHFQGSS